MRKFLTLFSLWLGLTASVFAAETFTLADGTSVTGDIIKSDDYGAMILTTENTSATYAWPKFSQDTLKQLLDNPKIRAYVEPFIAPTPTSQPAREEIKVNPVTRMASPEQLHPSLLGGLVQSSLGWFLLLVVYAANLYAAFEVAVVRGKPIGAVMGLSAVLPIIGPIIFLSQPMVPHGTEEAPLEEAAVAGAAPGGATPEGTPPAKDDIQILAASWQTTQAEEKKLQPQIFSRGKYTLNKRFIETKFAGFIGEAKGDAKIFSMEIKSMKEIITVDSITQTGPTEAILQTPNGEVAVPYADIMEIKLIPKPA